MAEHPEYNRSVIIISLISSRFHSVSFWAAADEPAESEVTEASLSDRRTGTHPDLSFCPASALTVFQHEDNFITCSAPVYSSSQWVFPKYKFPGPIQRRVLGFDSHFIIRDSGIKTVNPLQTTERRLLRQPFSTWGMEWKNGSLRHGYVPVIHLPIPGPIFPLR